MHFSKSTSVSLYLKLVVIEKTKRHQQILLLWCQSLNDSDWLDVSKLVNLSKADTSSSGYPLIKLPLWQDPPILSGYIHYDYYHFYTGNLKTAPIKFAKYNLLVWNMEDLFLASEGIIRLNYLLGLSWVLEIVSNPESETHMPSK